MRDRVWVWLSARPGTSLLPGTLGGLVRPGTGLHPLSTPWRQPLQREGGQGLGRGRREPGPVASLCLQRHQPGSASDSPAICDLSGVLGPACGCAPCAVCAQMGPLLDTARLRAQPAHTHADAVPVHRSMPSSSATPRLPMSTSPPRPSPTPLASTASPCWGSPPACPSTQTR